jgi:periplasmic protein CpxP/Spy
MRNRILVFAGIAVLVIGATAFALGRGFQEKWKERGEGRPRGDMVEHISRELNLTDAQKEQVKSIIEAQRSAEEARESKLDDLRKQIDAATANGRFDETQVRALASQEAQLMADSKVEHIRAHSKIYSLLNAEQRTKADEMMKHRGPHGRRHGPPPSE